MPRAHQWDNPALWLEYGMDLEPRQPVFIKEVQGNVWKMATIDQPAREPDSYWVRYPDNSILRRTHQMIKPWTQPSHLELETQSHERNTLEYRTSSNMQSFQTMFPEPGQQAFPTGKPAAAALQEPTSSVERQDIATSSPGSSGAIPSTLRRLTLIYKGHPTQEVLSIKSADHAEMLSQFISRVVFINVNVNISVFVWTFYVWTYCACDCLNGYSFGCNCVTWMFTGCWT